MPFYCDTRAHLLAAASGLPPPTCRLLRQRRRRILVCHPYRRSQHACWCNSSSSSSKLASRVEALYPRARQRLSSTPLSVRAMPSRLDYKPLSSFADTSLDKGGFRYNKAYGEQRWKFSDDFGYSFEFLFSKNEATSQTEFEPILSTFNTLKTKKNTLHIFSLSQNTRQSFCCGIPWPNA